MASQSFDFNTANFSLAERGIIGTTSVGPIVWVKIGIGLLRAVYEYRGSGILIGALGSGRPSQTLLPINTATRITLAPGVSQIVLAADLSAPATLDTLGSEMDSVVGYGVVIDGSSTSGTTACPELRTWCEALGGTYSPEIQ